MRAGRGATEALVQALVFNANHVCTTQALGGGGSADFAISAPVGATTSGRVRNLPGDTRKIQTALNRFPPRDGGPDPKLVVDGDCGRLTKGTILSLQKKFNLTPKKKDTPDGIVDVNGPTIDRLRAGPGRVPDGPKEFFARIPQVVGIATAARAALDAAIFRLQFGTRPGGLPGLDQLGQLAVDRAERHFHINSTQDPIARLRKVQQLFFRMQTAIGFVPKGMFLAVDEPPESAVGAFFFTVAGGFDIRDPDAKFDGTDLPVNSIYICPKGRALSEDGFAYGMIHELAHFVGPQHPDKADDPDFAITDIGAFHRGTIARLSADQAIRNADSYSQFAFDAIGKPNFNVDTGSFTPPKR
jgi:hypothetical protein